ncbi:uncharacterized protein ACR2FA_000239 [Aphomia sociella]
MSSETGSEMSAGDTKSINFKPSPNFKHMKKYLKFKFEEAGKMLEQSNLNVAIDEATQKITEQKDKVKLVLQPPLPPNSPPPDSPPSFTLKKEIEDVYEVNSEEKNVESEEYAVGVGSEPEKPKKTMCKDFVRGTCKRGESCIYAHELDLTQLRGVYKFCRDYANGKCKRPLCFFVHATTFEKEEFFRSGYLPPHTLNHIKEGNMGRPYSIPEGSMREMHAVYPTTQTEMQTGGGAGIPPIPIMAVPPTSVVKPKLPQDIYQASMGHNRQSLKREWTECAPASVPCENENFEPIPKKCLNCESFKLRYQENQIKRDSLIKSLKCLDDNILKLARKKNWLTTVLKVILSCPDSFNNSDISA